MTRPSTTQIKAMAEVAGAALHQRAAQRIANSIGPALDEFAAISGTLPFDLEPATFLLEQKPAERK